MEQLYRNCSVKYCKIIRSKIKWNLKKRIRLFINNIPDLFLLGACFTIVEPYEKLIQFAIYQNYLIRDILPHKRYIRTRHILRFQSSDKLVSTSICLRTVHSISVVCLFGLTLTIFDSNYHIDCIIISNAKYYFL